VASISDACDPFSVAPDERGQRKRDREDEKEVCCPLKDISLPLSGEGNGSDADGDLARWE